MASRTLILKFDDKEGGRSGTLEFFRRDDGGYAVRYDTKDGTGRYTFIGGRISDSDMNEIVQFHADHTSVS